MKKIFTFLICSLIVSLSFSQASDKSIVKKKVSRTYKSLKSAAYSNKQTLDKTVVLSNNDPRIERDREISKVNYINNIQVQRLADDSSLSVWEKRDALDALEFQRVQKVNVIYERYSDSVSNYTAEQINNSWEKDYNQNGHR